MDNLIHLFMNYKINRLVEYGVFFLQREDEFIRQVFRGYFRTYVDNYYYGVFNTVDSDHYTLKNLQLEFDGVMVEMLDDYRSYELLDSNEVYAEHQRLIRELNPICYEIVKIDSLEFVDKDDISLKVFDFIKKNTLLKDLIQEKENKLASMVRETYQTSLKLLRYEDTYYSIGERCFEKQKNKVFLELVPNIKALGVYRKSMVQKIYQDDRLELAKLECLIQKVSFEILKSTLEKKKIPTYFIEFDDSVISRGKFQNSIFSLIDNPLFRKYVVICVHYNTYLAQQSAFSEDYHFACIQDFTHINDIYQKTDVIYKEGIFNYLIVENCKYKDRDYFMNYENDTMEVLVFEEE